MRKLAAGKTKHKPEVPAKEYQIEKCPHCRGTGLRLVTVTAIERLIRERVHEIFRNRRKIISKARKAKR